MTEINDREKYTRVTNVLYPFSGLDKINVDIVAHAAKRGTKVHQVCEGIVAGLGEYVEDENIAGYVESFKQWWQIGHVVVEIEKRFWCDDLKITGQVDFIIKTDDGMAVVDLKTSYKPSKTWPVQGAAYAYLAKKENYDIKKIYFIHLSKNGKFPKIYEYDVDDSFFLAVYRTYMHFFYKEVK
jgi:hypothetical protein